MLKSGGGFVDYPIGIVALPRSKTTWRKALACSSVACSSMRTQAASSAPMVKDPKFHAAIFGHDDSPVPDMRPEELQQTRRYIIHGERTAPIRNCRHHPHGTPGLAVLCPSEARG